MVKRQQHRNRPRFSGFGSFFFGVACIALLWFVSSTGRLQAQSSGDEALPEPTLISVFPPGAQQGSRIELEIRGEALDGAYSVVFGSAGLEAQVGEVEQLERREPARPSPKKKSYPLFRVTAHLTVDSSVPAGTHRFRLVSPRGSFQRAPFPGRRRHRHQRDRNPTSIGPAGAGDRPPCHRQRPYRRAWRTGRLSVRRGCRPGADLRNHPGRTLRAPGLPFTGRPGAGSIPTVPPGSFSGSRSLPT